jgi:hypothetical protein
MEGPVSAHESSKARGPRLPSRKTRGILGGRGPEVDCWAAGVEVADQGAVMRIDETGHGEGLSPQAQLARRLNLLLDVVVAERGKPVTFREVQGELAGRGIKLSRARWFYMKEGTGRLVSDPVLLAGLCGIFKVDPSYLVGDDGALPERIDSQLEFVKSLRAARVKSFAARTLGDVSPETLQAISEYLNKDIGRHPGGEQAAITPPEDIQDEPPAVP